MSLIERAAELGAAALVQNGHVSDPETGDVLYDHDWTPIEAAREVLRATDYAGAVSEADELRAELARERADADEAVADLRALIAEQAAEINRLRGR